MLFEPPIDRLRCNVHTPSIARWKARGQLPIHYDWTFLLYHMVEMLSAKICRSWRALKGGGSLWVQISDGRRCRPPTTVGVRKLEWLPFRAVSKYPQCTVWCCHKACVCYTDRQTDRQTDGQNYNSEDRTSMAACTVKVAAYCLILETISGHFYRASSHASTVFKMYRK